MCASVLVRVSESTWVCLECVRGPRNALGYRPEPEVLPLPAETSREAQKLLRLAGGPETRSGTVQSLKCCPCQQRTSREAQKCCGLAASRGGPRNALGHRPEPEVLPLPAETSREAPECCLSAAPGSIKGGGPETRSGTVQSLKCCPCQQKRAARLPSALAASKGAPKRARVPSRA